MPNNFEPTLGHEFQFTVKPIPSLNLDGIFHCEVLELVPFQKLVYTWKGGPGDGIFSLDTVVEWTLEKHGKGTKLFLKQSGFNESNLSIFTSMTDGWSKLIPKMMDLLNEKNNGNTNV
jgi:uncharacterized protein YndB with AHSA1/START domain